MTPTNDELYAICWDVASRSLSIERRLLDLEESHQVILQILAKALPGLSDEDRVKLRSSAARLESSLDQNDAAFRERCAVFERRPNPKKTT